MERFEVVANFDWLEKEETIGFLGSPESAQRNVIRRFALGWFSIQHKDDKT